MISEGLITRQDIEEAKSGKGSKVISIGLPAYCLLQALLRSANANSTGLLISTCNTSSTHIYNIFSFPLPFFFCFLSLVHLLLFLLVLDETWIHLWLNYI